MAARMKAWRRLLAVAVLLGVNAAAAGSATRPPFTMPVRTATFTPGTPVRLAVVTDRATDVEAAVFPVSTSDAAGIVAPGLGPPAADALFAGRRALRIARERIEALGGSATMMSLRALPPGLYAVRVRADGETVGTVLVTVTTLGVATSEAGPRFAAYALDLKTLRLRTDVTFERRHGATDAVETARPGADGVAWFGGVERLQTDVVVARAAGGAVALVRVPATTQRPSSHLGYVQTDRPIYRPGDRVRYRAILRDGQPGALTVPTGERVVQLRDGAAKVVATATRALDAFGTLDGDFALPDALGTYQIVVGPSNEGSEALVPFAVEAYKKPEYVLDVAAPALAVGGDAARFGIAARYFFGRPAAGMTLHYRASLRPQYPWWRRGTPFHFAGYDGPQRNADAAPDVTGEVTADSGGRATIAIPTAVLSAEKTLDLEVDGRDETGRTVTAQARAQIVPASFYVTLEPSRWFVKAGDTVDLVLHGLAYGSNAPRAGAPIDVSTARVWWDGRERKEEPVAGGAWSVVTDAAGAATVHWKPAQSGYFEITARSRDERGRAVTTVGSVWISAERYDQPYTFDGVTVVPQKTEYRPGERALLLVTAPQGGVDALVDVGGGAGDRIFTARLESQTATIAVDPPAGVARYRVSVTVPTRDGLRAASAVVNVVPAPHRLRVAIEPGKARYAPGERARFAVHVRDPDGKPVRAQVGVAVVDDAIFALRQARQGDPFEVFYGSAGPNRNADVSWQRLDQAIRTQQSYVLQMIGRTMTRSANALPMAAAPNAEAAEPSFEQLRSDFRDTAFWSPSVLTGADGSALVTFAWPDSLTSYTASGLAVTQASDVGGGSGTALVTKDFLVRLGAPRFLRSGDTARITAVAQGLPSARSARLRFSAPALGVADVTTTARFDARAVAAAQWSVHGGELGSATLRLAGTSAALRDGMQVALPVETSGSAQHERAAGMLPLAASVALRLRPGALAGDLRIDLTPSAFAQLVAGTRLLDVYPYYCVEQTMSAALPSIYVDRLRKRLKLRPADGPAPEQVAKRAIQRLGQLQHADGSWGWWEHDPANPFMTAYALYGLAELAHDGYGVPGDTFARGVANLTAQIAAPGDTLAFHGGAQPNSEWNTRAFMLFALADARPAAVDRAILAKADAHAADLNAYALSVLGLAHLELDDRAGAQPLLAELLRRVTDDGSYARWKGEGWHYRWEDDPIETTAYALRFVHAMAPDDPHVPRAVNWLRAQQRGSWFETTKDTAAAIYAIAEAAPFVPGELDPHETVRVTLDGRPVKTVRIDAPVLSREDATIVVPARLLRAGGMLRFEREGTGALSWSTDWTQYVTGAPAGVAADPDLRVARTYSARGGNDWRVGDTVDVDLVVTAKTAMQYVAVEDPLPAGLEYQPAQYRAADRWSGLQFFDDRVVFFAARMDPNSSLHLHYTLRATTAGSFSAPAPSAYAMYGPPLSATGAPAKVAIRS